MTETDLDMYLQDKPVLLAEINHLRAEVERLKEENRWAYVQAALDDKDGAAEARIAELEKAARAVEEWWLSDGRKHFDGAPYAIFATRALRASAGREMVTDAMVEVAARAMHEACPIARSVEGISWDWDFLVASKWTLADTYRELARAALSTREGWQSMETAKDAAWPVGCTKPNPCSRHKSCMYHPCPHEQRDISGEVDAAFATRQARQGMECATQDCGKPATVRFERGGVGSHYCHDCYMRVQALASPTQGGSE